MHRGSLSNRLSVAAAGTAVAAAALLWVPAADAAPAPVHQARTVVTAAAVSHHTNHYAAARRAWIQGSRAAAAEQNRYLIRAARALVAAPGDRYFHQIRQLIDLTTYPNTSLTPRQIRQVRHLTRSLDRFFRTPGLYF